jgi:hypothetical protein
VPDLQLFGGSWLAQQFVEGGFACRRRRIWITVAHDSQPQGNVD